MSRTIGCNPDPTPNSQRDPKGPFRIEARVMEAMHAVVDSFPVRDARALWQERVCQPDR